MKTKKYHTVGTVPKYKYTTLSEQFQNKKNTSQNSSKIKKIPHCQNSSKIKKNTTFGTVPK
jgi:hypothetical protein